MNQQITLTSSRAVQTASDDLWRISPIEQAVVAVTFKNSFRDYYRRRGLQVNAPLQVHPQAELLFA